MNEYVKESKNIFLIPIFIKKKKRHFKSWRLLRKTIRKMKKISPDFETMMDIWKLLEVCNYSYMYAYHNNTTLNLFLGTTKDNKSHSMIYIENELSIKFLLRRGKYDNNSINIEIKRSENSIPEVIQFIDGQFNIKSIKEEEMFLFITSCLMNGASEVMKYYYKHKRF